MPSLTRVQSGFVEAQGALPLSSGTAAAPGLKFDDHAGTGMFSPSTGEIAFSTSGHSQAVTFKTDGKVGIGQSNPQSKLQIENSGEQLRLTYPSIASYIHEVKSNGDYAIDKDGSERLCITSAGNLGIKNTSPNNTLTVGDGVQTSYAPSTAGNYIEIARTSGADAGLLINKNTGQWLVGIDNSDGANAPLRFEYAAAGSAHPGFGAGTLGMIIKHDGNVGIGTDNPSQPITIKRESAGQGEFGVRLEYGNTTGPTLTNSAILVGSYGLKFKNYNSSRDFIFETGNVGIGTDNPASKLDILGILRLSRTSTYTSNVQLSITHEASSNYGSLYFDNSNATGDYVFRTTSSSTERLRITSAGNVGIGTNDPAALLHLESTAANAARLRIGFDSPRYYDIYRGSTTNSGYLNFYGSQTGFTGYIFDGVDGERLRITSGGNVGIGTASPGARLHVHAPGSDLSTIRLSGTAANQVEYDIRQGIVGVNNAGFSIRDITNSATRFVISHTGDVGIDQASPQSKVQIDLGDSVNYQNGDCLTLSSGDGSSANLVNKLNFGVSSTNSYAWIQSIKPGTDSRSLVLQPSGGNIGIGLTNPDKKLVISQANSTAYSPSDFDQNYHVLKLNNTTDSQTVGMQFLIGSNGEASISATETSDGNTDIAFGARGGGARKERVRIRSNGDLILGPYDAPGSYTTPANNVPYSIKVAPYGWQHHSELAEISMGNHSGSNGNDDGEIVFKTTQNAHSSTTGLVERLRIDSLGDSIFYGNPSIDATDLYYINTYNTNSWTANNWYTAVPHGLTGNCTYLVSLVWDYGGSGGTPYYLATQQLYSTVSSTNGTGSENELTPMCGTHTGGTGCRIKCRVLAQSGGSPAMQVNLTWGQGTNNYLKVKVWKMLFNTRI